MGISAWIKEHIIHIIVLSLLFAFAYVLLSFNEGTMSYEAARVYVQALTGIATLALLYYAYFSAVSKKEEDVARLELAVRPILVWELYPKGRGAELFYKALKHPIYDLRLSMRIGQAERTIEERHLDVFESNPAAARRHDISDFIRQGLSQERMRILEMRFSYHSEVGGKYELCFTKEVLRQKGGFVFQHRKIVSAKYPWKEKSIVFTD
ncbi:MAG: hypothetical protein N3E51_01450 [Candidatus Micrarchaeota archaeon]|nr:hypothetical protein [Candidatus Micrarchaeota archaeon]